LEALIKQSISNQKTSDVPLGAFLSGGINFSTVVGILQSLSDQPIKTFTIGFENPEFNEANEVADHLGTDHKELILSAKDALKMIEKLPSIYDEPFSDASQIPTYLVSQLAKQDVTVCLSGDGGDELFCGYNRYHYTSKVRSSLQWLPFRLRSALGSSSLALKPSFWDSLSRVLFLDKKLPNLGNKIQKGAQALKARSIDELYARFVSNWTLDETLVKDSSVDSLPMLSNTGALSQLNDLEKMMLWDMQSYLMDDALVKTDRATMACSLEGRVSLLAHRTTEFAAQLSMQMKYREGKGKWILRQVLHRYVPKELIERPKKGLACQLLIG
jgi:asparagine synthase (glutamine-hydrolysing)